MKENKSKIEKILERLEKFSSKLMPKGLTEISKNILSLEKILKPAEALNKFLYTNKSLEPISFKPLKLSNEDNEVLNNLELPEITNAKNINKLVEIVNRNSEISESNAKTANKLSLTAIIISIISIFVSIISIFVSIYLSKQPIKLNEQQFDKLLNKINSNTVYISQIVDYTEPSKTSKVTILRKLIRKK